MNRNHDISRRQLLLAGAAFASTAAFASPELPTNSIYRLAAAC